MHVTAGYMRMLQANQSLKTGSRNRRTVTNNDCRAVGVVGKVSAFLARCSVIAAGFTPVLGLALVLCSAPTASGGQRVSSQFLASVTLRRYTGEEMRTRNQVAIADGLAESGWGLALYELR